MPIYLDNHATTQLDPEVRDAMLAYFDHPGNSNSPHQAGAKAAAAIEEARQRIADLIGASPGEIVFTSGATEADNLAVRGVAKAVHSMDTDRRHLVISSIEHKAVIATAESLISEGYDVDFAPVSASGVVSLAALDRLITTRTSLVSVMAVNNEIATVQPLKEISALARKRGALFHTDAAQAVGRIPVDVFDAGVDYLSISAHKMHGPQGIGALYISAAAPPLSRSLLAVVNRTGCAPAPYRPHS